MPIDHGESSGITVPVEVFCGGYNVCEKNGSIRLMLTQLFVNFGPCFEEPIDIGFWHVHLGVAQAIFEVQGSRRGAVGTSDSPPGSRIVRFSSSEHNELSTTGNRDSSKVGPQGNRR
jgi:hypothetical protein